MNSITHLAESQTVNFSSILEELSKDNDDRKFAVTQSNPPYQEIVSESNGKTLSLWQGLIDVSGSFSERMTYVNPARWVTSKIGENKIIHKLAIHERRLKELIILPEGIFENVGITGGVCIEYFNLTEELEDFKYTILTNTKESYTRKFDECKEGILSPKDQSIVNKILTWNYYRSIRKDLFISGQDNRTKRITSQPASEVRVNYGIMSQRLHRDTDYFILDSEKDSEIEYAKIYYLDNSVVCERFLPKTEFTEIPKNKERLEKWQLLFLRSNPELLHERNFVISEPGSLATNSWMGRSFNTRKEAENFHSYLKTDLYRYLLKLKATGVSVVAAAHSYVPDLSKITNPRTNRVGYDSDWTNDDLYKIFKNIITDNEWLYMRESLRV